MPKKHTKNTNKKPKINFAAQFIQQFSISISVIGISLAAIASLLTLINPTPSDIALATVTTEDVMINGITQDGDDFLVDFTTIDFTNSLVGLHTHFYFDTEQNDVTNKMHFGGSPYGLPISSIDSGATQLCTIVGNSDHSINPGTGNCFTLPTVEDLSVTLNSAVLNNTTVEVDFTTNYFVSAPSDFHVNFYFDTELPSSTAREYYSTSPYTFDVSEYPAGATQICGIVADDSNITVSNSSTCTALPTPPTPKTAGITGITEVGTDFETAFTISGFTNTLGGDYTRFYFDTETSSITDKEFFGTSPFTLPISNVPSGATQLCVIVVETGTGPIPGSGNCFNLPAVTPPTPQYSAAILQISQVNDDIEVGFQTSEFTNSVAGPYTRFYFDTESVNVSTNDFTNPSPFTLPITAIPVGATQLCVVVVDTNSLPLPSSGNCVAIPMLDAGTGSGGGGDNGNNDGNTGNGNPFETGSPTSNQLTAIASSSKDNYTVGESIRMDVDGIKLADGSFGIGLNCIFTINFTPSATNQIQTIQVSKFTDTNGDCFVEILGSGVITKNTSIFDIFSIDANAQSLAPGSITDIFDENGVGSFQASVTGSNGQTYFTNSDSFVVGDITNNNTNQTQNSNTDTTTTTNQDASDGQDTLVRSGGTSVVISLLVAGGVALFIQQASRKDAPKSKTKIR